MNLLVIFAYRNCTSNRSFMKFLFIVNSVSRFLIRRAFATKSPEHICMWKGEDDDARKEGLAMDGSVPHSLQSTIPHRRSHCQGNAETTTSTPRYYYKGWNHERVQTSDGHSWAYISCRPHWIVPSSALADQFCPSVCTSVAPREGLRRQRCLLYELWPSATPEWPFVIWYQSGDAPSTTRLFSVSSRLGQQASWPWDGRLLRRRQANKPYVLIYLTISDDRVTAFTFGAGCPPM